MSKSKKFLTLFESALSRYERGGFQIGDVFKFNDDFKSSDQYKNLGVNTQQMIDEMIESGLHVRVVGIKDTTFPVFPGNPQTSTADVGLTLALDTGGGRYTHYISVSPMLGQPEVYGPNLPPIPDAMIRKSEVNINPKELKKQSNMANKTDRGNGKLIDTEISNARKNTTLPNTLAAPHSMEVGAADTHGYLGDIKKESVDKRFSNHKNDQKALAEAYTHMKRIN